MYIFKHKYNDEVFDTAEELLLAYGYLYPIKIEYDYEDLIAYNIYDTVPIDEDGDDNET